MPNELRFTATVFLANGRLTDQVPQEVLQVTQSAALFLGKTVDVPTSQSDLDTTGITTLGWAFIKNLDTTNYVQYGPKSGGTMVALGRLRAGEWALSRIEPGTTIRWVANTATVRVLVKLYND